MYRGKGEMFIKNPMSAEKMLLKQAGIDESGFEIGLGVGFGVCLGLKTYETPDTTFLLVAWADGLHCVVSPIVNGQVQDLDVNWEVPDEDFERMWGEGVEPNV
jgi:hypothetical protein